MKVFLTGGTGFIASHILIKLFNEGFLVTALARSKNKIPKIKTFRKIRSCLMLLILKTILDWNSVPQLN